MDTVGVKERDRGINKVGRDEGKKEKKCRREGK